MFTNKKKSYRIYLFLLLSAFLIPANVYSQTEIIVEDGLARWTPDGIVVFASTAALSQDVPVDGKVQSVIYRRIGDDQEFMEVARLQRAETWDEFVERAGDDLIEWFRSAPELTTDEEIWTFIKENPGIEDFGFRALEMDFWRAYGTAYLDREAVTFSKGQKVTYQVRYIMEDGSESDLWFQGSEVVGETTKLMPPVSVERFESDSTAGGLWVAPLEGSEDAFYGRVYRQTYPDEEFVVISDRISAQRVESDGDSLVAYEVVDDVEPERAYRYFVEPLDMFGIPGPPSDTLLVISVDFNNLPLMGNITAVDTTSGIHLSWEPIPNKPYIVGVEIQRSRDSRGNHIVIDTLSVTETEYLDTQIVPNIVYNYEFRIVTVRQKADLPSGVVSKSFRNEDMPPLPPANLKAEQEENGIRLHWAPNPEPDLFGYYVYRGTSRQDSMAVISQAIKETTTFFDDSEELDGRTNYVYKVQAISLSELESDFSNEVVIRPDRPVRPPEPAGISGYAEQNRIRISWRDVQLRDGAVEGYRIYRGTAPLQNVQLETDASETALENGYELLNDTLITTTFFDDVNVTSGQTYYYAISSVDLYDVESELSNAASFTPEEPSLIAPTQVSARNVTGGVEIRWGQTLQSGAEQFHVYRRTRDSETAERIATLSLNDTQYVDSNAQAGNLYWYSVSVANGSRESARSREQSVRVN